MARKKKKQTLTNIFLLILIIVLGIIIVKAIEDNRIKEEKEFIKEEKEKIEEKIELDKKEEKENNKKEQITNAPSSDEKEETKNEIERRKNSNINIELIGEDEITIKKNSKFIDQGFRAQYEDGTDAKDEVNVDNAVDTSKEGTYTITYSSGNTIIIRRVIVE